MKKPECSCFTQYEEAAEEKVNIVADETTLMFAEEFNAQGLCANACEYALVVTMATMMMNSVDSIDGPGGGYKRFEEWCDRLVPALKEQALHLMAGNAAARGGRTQ